MKLTLDLTKSLEENASYYFEQSKKAKNKAQGAKIALKYSRLKLKTVEEEIKKKERLEKAKPQKQRKKEWYEKFRWFFTSDNDLVIAGRDAATNEIVVKKHVEKKDLIFHTEMAGSPFGVLKVKEDASKISIQETATFIGCYSKSWKLGRTVMDVFYVNPEQVTKQAPSGEYITRGSFMIYGKKTILTVDLKLYIGIMADGKIMAGPKKAIEKHCNKHVELVQGNEKISAVAQKIKKELNASDLDEIVRLVPMGSKLK